MRNFLLGLTAAVTLLIAIDLVRSNNDPTHAITKTHIIEEGRNGSPKTIVLIHGFSAANWVFDELTPHLIDQDYRVIRFDLIGRGQSPRINTTHDLELFNRQLEWVIEYKQLGEFELLGYSMGSIIAANYAINNPDRVSKTFLISPAGLMGAPSISEYAVNIPYINELLVRHIATPDYLANMRQEIDNGWAKEHWHDLYRQDLTRTGSNYALASTLRHIDLYNQGALYLDVSTQGQVHVIWGNEDAVVHHSPVKVFDKHQLACIANAAHALPYSHSADLARLIKGFKPALCNAQTAPFDD